jgi:hypothetical protein
VICNSCQVKSQVKTITSAVNASLPRNVLGGSWAPKSKMLGAGNFVPYFFIFVSNHQVDRILYLPSSHQSIEMFQIRKPLSLKAKSPGWIGYQLNLRSIEHNLIELSLA